MNILIADDHAIVREGVKQIIKTLPEVNLIDEASDGNIAYTKILSKNYDLVVLDISMPGITGLDLLQRMKNKDIKTNVLIFKFLSSGTICYPGFQTWSIRLFIERQRFRGTFSCHQKNCSRRKVCIISLS